MFLNEFYFCSESNYPAKKMFTHMIHVCQRELYPVCLFMNLLSIRLLLALQKVWSSGRVV